MVFEDFKELLDNIPDGVSIIDKDLKLEWVNKALHDKGFHCEGVKGKKCYFIYKQRNSICRHCPTLKVFVTGKTIRLYERGADGKHYEVTAIPVKTNGQVEKVIEIVRELKGAKPFAVSMKNTPGVMAFVIDTNGRVVALNNSAEKMLGYTEKELAGTNFIRVMPKKAANEFRKKLANIINGTQFPSFTTELRAKKGTIIPARLNCNPFHSNGSVIGIEVVAENITEQANAEKLLKESEEKYKSLVENAAEFIYLIGKDKRVISLNSSAAKLFGKKPEELVGKSIFDLFPKDIAAGYSSGLDIVFNTGKPRYSHSILQAPNGARKWINVSLSPVKDNEEKVVSVIGMSRDITEKKEAELQLKKEKETAERYLNLAGSFIVALNKKGNIHLINKRGYEILGYKDGSLNGKNWFDTCIPKEERAEIKIVFKKCMEGESTLVEHFENNIITRKGEKRLIIWHNTTLKDERGNITGTLSSGDDITDQLLARKIINESKRKYRLIFDLCPEGILILGRNGVLIDANPQTFKWLGYRKEELVGKNIKSLKIFTPESRKKVLANFLRRLKGEKISPYEIEVVTKSGKIKVGQISANVLADERGEATGIIVIVSNITELAARLEKIKKKCGFNL